MAGFVYGFALLAFLSYSPSIWGASLEAPNPLYDQGLDGTYKGSMLVTVGGVTRDIPLAISLVVTETVSNNPGEYIFDQQMQLNGSFLVDDEGGPFFFQKIDFDISDGTIELQYFRSGEANSGAPANLKYLGQINPEGNISGAVYSRAAGGIIGSFDLSKSSRGNDLVKRYKYTGEWEGEIEFEINDPNIPRKGKLKIAIEANSRLEPTKNPAEMDLEYTEGRVGSAEQNDTVQFPFKQVVVDYFQRKMFLVHSSAGGTTLVYQCDIDFDRNTLEGISVTSLRGTKTATFKLKRIR